MYSTETICTIWQFFIIIILLVNTLLLFNNRKKLEKIDNIFISHLHGDHFFGLIGLLSTLHLLDRKKDLHIYSPQGLKEIIVTQLRITNTHLSYFIHFHEISSKEPIVILDDKKLTVKALPLKHRIETYGFLFEEKLKERKLNIEAANKYNVEICDYRNLKLGKDFVNENGEIIKHEVFRKYNLVTIWWICDCY